MDPADYDADEWTALWKSLQPREVRNLSKRAYRRVAKEVRKIALRELSAAGIEVRGRQGDWNKALRAHIYSLGGGFLITSRFRGKKGFHINRQGLEKPILYWADHGTKERYHRTRGKTMKAHYTGQMPEYGFTEKANPEMLELARRLVMPEMEKATRESARKAGFAI